MAQVCLLQVLVEGVVRAPPPPNIATADKVFVFPARTAASGCARTFRARSTCLCRLATVLAIPLPALMDEVLRLARTRTVVVIAVAMLVVEGAVVLTAGVMLVLISFGGSVVDGGEGVFETGPFPGEGCCYFCDIFAAGDGSGGCCDWEAVTNSLDGDAAGGPGCCGVGGSGGGTCAVTCGDVPDSTAENNCCCGCGCRGGNGTRAVTCGDVLDCSAENNCCNSGGCHGGGGDGGVS